ncbi:MAG: diaminopimelate decarboxylase [Dehalococcoidia bacterium]
MELTRYPLMEIAEKVGTPFYLYDADILRQKFGELASLTQPNGLQCRYAIKANSARKVLEVAHEHGMWIDAVSGNEVLRAKRAGFAMGHEPPVVMYTADVFRDNALQAVVENAVLPNVGSPGMIRQLSEAGYRGPIALRINPGFGHGHVQACDTGGPSSKHGIWYEDHAIAGAMAKDAGFPVVALHAHVGTGPQIEEFDRNMRHLAEVFEDLMAAYPEAGAVNLGGGIPHAYRPDARSYDLPNYQVILVEAQRALSEAAGRKIRVEIEPGRYPVAGMACLVGRVTDVKATRTNQKGPGHEFIMTDAGFNDLIRPAMYGSYHRISIVGKGAGRPEEQFVVAGPLCESGDVFTRDEHELLEPRGLPRPDAGDLVVLHDAGAYGAAMSSNYVSLGRAAQVYWEQGHASLISRRETLDDIVARECDEALL